MFFQFMGLYIKNNLHTSLKLISYIRNFLKKNGTGLIYIMIFAASLSTNSAKAADDIDYIKTYGRVDNICRAELVTEYVLLGQSRPFATYKEDVMCLDGEINSDGARSAIEILRTHDIKNVHIWSNGGDADAALDLAEEMLRHDLDVYAFYRCSSSCANYIFFAGSRKHILPGAIVSWHGAPIAKLESPPELKQLWEKHKAFFKKIGVNDEVTRLPPACNYENNEPFWAELKNNIAPSWTYRRKTLENYYHVTGIMDMWEKPLKSDEKEDNSSIILSKDPIIFLFHVCN